ncbi:MAG: dienelactone hydrolase family protein [Frankiaceae bacterium]
MRLRLGAVELDGDLDAPADAGGVVVFAHGSGSSRHSPRNKLVAAALRTANLATLLLDLLTPAEEQLDLRTRELRFDVGMLGERVTGVVAQVAGRDDVGGLPVGVFGASTGAAAALLAAAQTEQVRAVVSRGGRPDLAMPVLGRVRAPTLLIVGGADPVVADLNRAAAARLGGQCRLEVIAGATHLFEEPGALEQVSALAADWFSRYLVR